MHDTVLHSRAFVNCMRLKWCTDGLDSSSMNRLAGPVQQIQTNDPSRRGAAATPNIEARSQR